MTPQFSKLDLTKSDKVEELLNVMYDEELSLELGWRKKYFLHDGFFVQLKEAIKGILDQGLYKKIVMDAVVVDSQEVTDAYTQSKEEFKMPESARVNEILLDSKEKAEMVHKLVMANPQAFDSLAAVYSTGSSSARAGETGLVRRGMMSPEYDKLLFKLKVGAISDVFYVKENVWTIIKMVEYLPEQYKSLEEVRNMIESRLRRQKQGEIANAFLTKMKEEADIQIFLPAQEETPEQKPQGQE
jgi:parvulin-like peptidyl-prolyl isomerase